MTVSRYKQVLIAMLVAAFNLPSASAERLTAEAIAGKAYCVAYYQGDSGRARASMAITDGQGRSRKRQLTLLRRDAIAGPLATTACGAQRYYAYFHRPADLRKTGFLVWKREQGDDDRWLYLPALDLVKRVAAGDKRTSFVGSHYFYEDMSGRNPELDEHTLVTTEAQHYVLKHTPKSSNSVEFASYTSWIDRETYMPMRIEYQDDQGVVYRTYETLQVNTVEGYPTITLSRISDSRMGGETTITLSRVSYDLNLDESLFTERYLRNPPRRYLR